MSAPHDPIAARPQPTFLNPSTLAKPPGYTHVVTARGKTIYVAGQVALNAQGETVGKGDFRAQSEQVFENLQMALQAAGASFHDVVKMNTYVLDLSQLMAFREVRDRYVNTENPPASTLVQVSKLFREEFLLEIEVIAVVAE